MRSRRERGILILILALSVGLIMLGVFIMGQYEYSVLTSYAKQQDSYVKLVLDRGAVGIRPFKLGRAACLALAELFALAL